MTMSRSTAALTTGRADIGRSRPDPAGDEGAVTVLVIGYALLALALVLVVVSASAVHLDRKRLLALTDAAALAAADDADTDAYYRSGVRPGQGVPLTDAGVTASVRAYLKALPPEEFTVTVDPATGTDRDGRTALVRLCADLQPPFTGWVLRPWSDGFTACTQASARTPLR